MWCRRLAICYRLGRPVLTVPRSRSRDLIVVAEEGVEVEILGYPRIRITINKFSREIMEIELL